AWARPVELGLDLTPGGAGGPAFRATGDALLVAPLRLERPAAGERVTVPAALVSCRRVAGRGLVPLPREFNQAADVRLRFQLPAEVLPLRVERVRLLARFEAPGRRLTLSG